MARNEAPPFERGKTFFDGATISSDDVTNTNYLLGKEWVFEDVDNSTNPVAGLRTGHNVKCRLVRNIAGSALIPKKLVTLAIPATSGYTKYGLEIDGYCDTTAEKVYPLDEWLPSAGLADDDIGWIVIEGPATVLTDLAGGANNVITVNDPLVALTAVTSGSTTAGRAVPIDLTGATALLGNQILNAFGRAMSAKTTGNTNANLLVLVGKF